MLRKNGRLTRIKVETEWVCHDSMTVHAVP